MKINIENVGIIKKCDVEFIPGINLIVGSSGSGKSTLMKCIYNMVANEFTDADIMFGTNTMSATITNGDHTITYERSVKPKGDKCKYVVDGNTYVKLGRASLQAVTDVLKFGDICINGDDVNFNFNLQFSSPFLIFGSQSTLYNVLTYRSNFDISSMNDYYISDVKSNNSEIVSSNKLKEKLESNLCELENQAAKIQPVEQLYSEFVAYKHNVSDKEQITLLKKLMHDASTVSSDLIKLDSLIGLVSSVNDETDKLVQLIKYADKVKSVSSVESYLNNVAGLSSKYASLISESDKLLNLQTLSSSMTSYEQIVSNLSLVSDCIRVSERNLSDKDFIDDLMKQYDLIKTYNKYVYIVSSMSYNGDVMVNQITDLITVQYKIKELLKTSERLTSLLIEYSDVEEKMSLFEICPLCNRPLNNHGDHKDGKEN